MRVAETNRVALEAFAAACKKQYEAFQAQGLKLDMSRGKPSPKQLDLTNGITNCLSEDDYKAENGLDCRNYGCLDGLPEAKAFFAPMLGVKPEAVNVCGNSSLNIMYWAMSLAMTNGVRGSKPWGKYDKVKVLCPVPGYDRHFKVTESFGFELITFPMTETVPNMDLVEQLVKDPAVKGMWNVPKYSTPDGIIYSAETIERIARLKPAAPDFLLMCDNAYCIHEFEGEFVPFPDILSLCEKYGNADMVFEFASTSKITLPGAGVACFACSEANMEYMEKLINVQIISYDKINQLRHVKYLKDKAHTLELMKKHAAIMGPKFKAVTETLTREVGPRGLATWHDPKGGDFVSVNTLPGRAKRTLALCKEAGVIMTSAGAPFHYGVDPKDSNIRVAPSLAPVEELQQAMEVFCCCLKLAALEQLK